MTVIKKIYVKYNVTVLDFSLLEKYFVVKWQNKLYFIDDFVLGGIYSMKNWQGTGSGSQGTTSQSTVNPQ